jgi:hypothetical protein
LWRAHFGRGFGRVMRPKECHPVKIPEPQMRQLSWNCDLNWRISWYKTFGFTVPSKALMQNVMNHERDPTLRCRSSASRRILARRICDLLCCITKFSNVAICWFAIERISASSTRASAAAKLSLCNAASGSLKSKGLKSPWFNSCFTLSDLK